MGHPNLEATQERVTYNTRTCQPPCQDINDCHLKDLHPPKVGVSNNHSVVPSWLAGPHAHPLWPSRLLCGAGGKELTVNPLQSPFLEILPKCVLTSQNAFDHRGAAAVPSLPAPCCLAPNGSQQGQELQATLVHAQQPGRDI